MRFLASILLAAASVNAADVSVGITIGPPPPPRVVAVPASRGAGYVWVEGYWYPVGHKYQWHNGYWTRPPYAGAHWVVPRHDGHLYFGGYWDGDHGRREHDHRWDHDRDRDYNRH